MQCIPPQLRQHPRRIRPKSLGPKKNFPISSAPEIWNRSPGVARERLGWICWRAGRTPRIWGISIVFMWKPGVVAGLGARAGARLDRASRFWGKSGKLRNARNAGICGVGLTSSPVFSKWAFVSAMMKHSNLGINKVTIGGGTVDLTGSARSAWDTMRLRNTCGCSISVVRRPVAVRESETACDTRFLR